jgi:hypothetical protein
MGSTITSYIPQIIYAVHHDYYIDHVPSMMRYTDTRNIYGRVLLEYIESHNASIGGKPSELIYKEWLDPDNMPVIVSEAVIAIKQDIGSYFRSKILPQIRPNLLAYANAEGFTQGIPFNLDKAIIVHLRLEDVAHLPPCDRQGECRFFYNQLDKGIPCSDPIPSDGSLQVVCQRPIEPNKILKMIDTAKTAFPDHDVYLVCSPLSQIHAPFPRIMTGNDQHDLWLMANAHVLITSISTYSLMAVYYSCRDDQQVYMPLWNHVAAAGFGYEPFDKSRLHYVY